MILAVKRHIQKELPFLMEAKLLIAVSGGVDSVVLTHLMHQSNATIALAHVNFNLRATASDKDQMFVEHLGRELQIPVFIHQVDALRYANEHKMSIQMAAREIRYQWFDKLLIEKQYDYLLTAHHLDDVVETFFINLNRATGLEGLTGIPRQNGSVVRPLLPFDRDEILAYAKLNGLTWREDQSNASIKYLRNKIRHQLLPVLKEINPEFRKALLNTQSYLNESKKLIDDYINSLKPLLLKEKEGIQYIAIDKLQQLPNKNAVLYELLKEYGFTQWEDIYQLPEGQTGKTIYSKTHFLLKDRVFLKIGVLYNKQDKQKKHSVITGFTVNNRDYMISTVSKLDTRISDDANEAYIDKSKINFPLFVRKWQDGDYFYPLGMQGKKKLSDFLIDQKVSRIEKEKIYLLCDAQNTVIWVIGKRLDDRFKITETTEEILKITT